MYALCISPNLYDYEQSYLTKNKIYEIIENNSTDIKIYDNSNELWHYPKRRFVILPENSNKEVVKILYEL